MAFLVIFWLGLGTPAILRQNPNKLSFEEKKSWDWQTPPQLGQNPKFFQKFDLKAPLKTIETCASIKAVCAKLFFTPVTRYK